MKSLVTQGIHHLVEQGFSAMAFGYTENFEKKRITNLSPNNPLHRQLFELFKLDGVVENVVKNGNSIIIKAVRTKDVTDSFFSEGFYKVIKD